MQSRAVTSLPVALAALAAIGFSPSASAVTEAPVASRQREHHQVDAAKTVVELQPFRRATSIQAATSGSQIGKATLIELNPEVNAWYLLALDFSLQGVRATYHLENRDPLSQRLRLDASYPSGILIDSRGGKSACDLWSAVPTALEQARRSGQPYAPLCDARLYLRNAVTGRATALERVTDFLRDHVWAGEKIIGFVRKELFRDAFLERATPGSSRAPAGAEPALPDGPGPASLDPAASGRMVQPAHLGLDLASAGRELLLGRWYRVNGLPGVFASVVQPRAVSSEILAGHGATVNALDPVEAEALVYLVAFDLAAFDLGFAIGTTHPRVDWSTRVLSEVRDDTIPGPDGIGTLAPLVANGMISPALAGRTVATFTGGFKREHSAFRYGVLARQNHGSHYGLVEQGAVLSKLVPGLATLHVFNDGTVAMKTWTERDDILLSRIRHARQNGVPLIEHDAATGRSTPGPLVAQWGAGNWSGSAEGNLRTLRAGACLQESGSGRFLVYGYFSSATPSAMARTFQAYGCRYAMHLDMNALEHTYLALYVRRDDQLEVEHLIQGMAQLDQKSAQGLVPRFLGIPDDRDFFYVTRRERPR